MDEAYKRTKNRERRTQNERRRGGNTKGTNRTKEERDEGHKERRGLKTRTTKGKIRAKKREEGPKEQRGPKDNVENKGHRRRGTKDMNYEGDEGRNG